MVIGGYPEPAYGKVEIYDLSGQNLTCPSINDYTLDYGSFGTFINNKTLVCGGYQLGIYYSECNTYNMQVNIKIVILVIQH